MWKYERTNKMNIEPKTPWRTSERKEDRRKKDGSKEDRKTLADVLKAGRYCSCSNCERDEEAHPVLPIVFIMGVVIMFGIILLLFMGKAHAETIEGYQINTWAEAIHHAEGNNNYGILAHYKQTSYKQACINTVRHNYKRWIKAGKPDKYLDFLGARYCPVGCNNDNGTNKYWVDNVGYWLWRLNK